MQTTTFKGKSERIAINGSFTNLKVLSCTSRVVTPLIHFLFMDGEDEIETIEINYEYEVLYTVEIYFESAENDECSIGYLLTK